MSSAGFPIEKAWAGLGSFIPGLAHGSLICNSSRPSRETLAIVPGAATTLGTSGSAAEGSVSLVTTMSPWAMLRTLEGGGSTTCTLNIIPCTCGPAETAWTGLAVHPDACKAAATDAFKVPKGKGPVR